MDFDSEFKETDLVLNSPELAYDEGDDEEGEVVVKPKKKSTENVIKERKDHVNVVFIGHVGMLNFLFMSVFLYLR